MIKYMTGHQLILSLMPMDFIPPLRAAFIFPDQIRANANIFN